MNTYINVYFCGCCQMHICVLCTHMYTHTRTYICSSFQRKTTIHPHPRTTASPTGVRGVGSGVRPDACSENSGNYSISGWPNIRP